LENPTITLGEKKKKESTSFFLFRGEGDSFKGGNRGRRVSERKKEVSFPLSTEGKGKRQHRKKKKEKGRKNGPPILPLTGEFLLPKKKKKKRKGEGASGLQGKKKPPKQGKGKKKKKTSPPTRRKEGEKS